MKEYICKDCGKKCYSAVTEISSMIDPTCPYCGGEIQNIPNILDEASTKHSHGINLDN